MTLFWTPPDHSWTVQRVIQSHSDLISLQMGSGKGSIWGTLGPRSILKPHLTCLAEMDHFGGLNLPFWVTLDLGFGQTL